MSGAAMTGPYERHNAAVARLPALRVVRVEPLDASLRGMPVYRSIM